MFIQTEGTPNPATLKFLPGRDVMSAGLGPMEFSKGDDVNSVPLAEMLFSIPGIERVFFGQDFISITRGAQHDWPRLKPAVMGAIMDYYVAGGDVITGATRTDVAEEYEGETLEIVEQIIELIETRVRPAVAQDGGDILFKRFDVKTGDVYLQMKGACAGCPSSSMTLKSGVENLLKHYVPEVSQVIEAF
ncbi:MAG TPA: NifU family protein [Hellea balneolensis]|uniref:NifU family protein n=1 Tax=Hellea balneolensis TaxID=287478 RepID=A0A7C3C0G1_9PROT|nr:NifU family protein [Hellea balneolensis]